jgi:hypothetical protein
MVELVVEWLSNVSGQNLIKGILAVTIDQPQECRFFLPFMFLINVVRASFEYFS